MENGMFPMPEFANKTLENILNEPGRKVGHTLGDIWDLVIGSRISVLAEKRRIICAAELEEYRKAIEEYAHKIPREKYKEPDMLKAASILDASQYCFDKRELREMFVKLLGATMNKDMDRYVHISFGEILKQIVPDEIKILTRLPEKSLFEPLIGISIEKPEVKGKFTLYTNLGVLGQECGCEFPEELSLYVNNLIRLGIVTVPEDQYLVEGWRYSKILSDTFIQETIHKAEEYGKVYIIHKMIGITELGDAIRKICM